MAQERKALTPWQIRTADDLMRLIERLGRPCALTLTWTGHVVVRVWHDRDGSHVEFPEGGV